MVLCIVSPFVYSCLFPICTVQVYRASPRGGDPIAVNKYHISYFVCLFICLFVCLSGGSPHLSSPTLSTLYLLVTSLTLQCVITIGTD
jgi:hypothetical protein